MLQKQNITHTWPCLFRSIPGADPNPTGSSIPTPCAAGGFWSLPPARAPTMGDPKTRNWAQGLQLWDLHLCHPSEGQHRPQLQSTHGAKGVRLQWSFAFPRMHPNCAMQNEKNTSDIEIQPLAARLQQ